ncbi:hypothetical protein [Pacificispira sp.]|uniref:hypothetical protein n=1 Tax=Pacificispira sp. TaxID=2888761 RepID=UPI003BAA7331
MSTDDIRPKTLGGIKQLAKRLKKREGCPHHVALDMAAQAAGFSNYKHAFQHFDMNQSLSARRDATE